MADNADPLQGWSLKDVEDTSSGPATADIYGKLFYHIQAELHTFLNRLSDMQVSFQLLCVDFKDELGCFLERNSFSRIEVGRALESRSYTISQYLDANQLNPGLQYFGQLFCWNTLHSCPDGALPPSTAYQPTRDSHHFVPIRRSRAHHCIGLIF